MGRTNQVHDRRVYRAGSVIFQQGWPGDRAYFVQSGLVEIVKTQADGRERVLGRIGQGGFFGEMALLDDQPRMASARAVEHTVCVAFSARDIRERMERADPFLRGLLHILMRSVRTLADEMA